MVDVKYPGGDTSAEDVVVANGGVIEEGGTTEKDGVMEEDVEGVVNGLDVVVS